MTANQPLFNDETRGIIEQIAASGQSIDAQRAAALLAVANGRTQAEAAATSGLSEGQVSYALRKFREKGLGALGAADSIAAASTAEAEQLRALIDQLNARVDELQQATGQQATGEAAIYSPGRLLILVRDNVQKLTPEMQLDVLRNFQGMSAEDFLDIETWKGLAYMMTYSARFQAGQVRGKVSDTINQVVPEPIQPGRLWRWGKSGLERITPDIAKQILSTFQGATREDLLDPNTWKGVWYMITYSLQFQAEQLKQRLSAANESSSE
jgi:hypothetical protein